MTTIPDDAGFYDWWKQHYDMANLAMGAAEDAWNAATAVERERCANIADRTAATLRKNAFDDTCVRAVEIIAENIRSPDQTP